MKERYNDKKKILRTSTDSQLRAMVLSHHQLWSSDVSARESVLKEYASVISEITARGLEDMLNQETVLHQEALKLLEQVEFPKNSLAMTANDTFTKVDEQGEKFAQEAVKFQIQAETPGTACGTCRFYLREEREAVGRCEVVDGAIPWAATSDLYISAESEARAAFLAQTES